MFPADLLDLEPYTEALGIKPGLPIEQARVLVVVGENASGKSFLRRLLVQNLVASQIPVMHLSQEGRADGGGYEGIKRLMLYGSETRHCTSQISTHVITTGIKTSRSHEQPHVLIWDEPEIGMGEEVKLGSAQWLAQELQSDWPEKLLGVVVMTHSREFVQALLGVSNAFFMELGEDRTAEEWLARTIVPVFPEELEKRALAKSRQIMAARNLTRKRA